MEAAEGVEAGDCVFLKQETDGAGRTGEEGSVGGCENGGGASPGRGCGGGVRICGGSELVKAELGEDGSEGRGRVGVVLEDWWR